MSVIDAYSALYWATINSSPAHNAAQVVIYAVEWYFLALVTKSRQTMPDPERRGSMWQWATEDTHMPPMLRVLAADGYKPCLSNSPAPGIWLGDLVDLRGSQWEAPSCDKMTTDWLIHMWYRWRLRVADIDTGLPISHDKLSWLLALSAKILPDSKSGSVHTPTPESRGRSRR
jgi:hypothetical protein